MSEQNITTTFNHEGYLTIRRVLSAPDTIVFLGGINLILIQWVLVRELTTLLLGTELVILLVSVSFFAGLSLGYWVSKWFRRNWFRQIGMIALILHLTLPFWFRLIVASLDAMSVYWATFIIMPLITPFVVSAFYSILLPLFADTADGDLPRLYTVELSGSAIGVLALVLLGGLGLMQVFILYCINMIIMLVLFGSSIRLTTVMIIMATILIASFPKLDAWSNAVWFQQLRNLPSGSSTVYSAYSPYQKVDVLQDPDGNLYLYLDGLLHFGTNRWSRLNVMMGSVPAELVHPGNSLVIGAGSMQLERMIAERSGIVTTVELDPLVVEASSTYFAEYNLVNTLTNREIIIDDARHFVANASKQFDLVVTDVPATFSIQTAALYSTSFYENIEDILRDEGLLVVNLTTRLDEGNLVARRIAASVLTVFDDVVIVTSESSGLSYAFASNNLPFELVEVQSVLENNGETEYILYQRSAIELIVDNAPAIQLDSMDIVLQISAGWIADRFTWR